MIDREFATENLVRLVRINSVNPTLDPGAPGEAEIAEHLAGALRSLGLEVAVFEPEPQRVTVTGTLRGTGGGRSLMFNAHVDTVGVQGMEAPFSGEIREGRLYGRGAYDMKGSLAAGLAAMKALAESADRLPGDVVFAAVADEEYGSLGTSDLIRHVKVDGAIVTEPTALQVCLAHKGYLWIEVEVKGQAAHGSRFEAGVDANMKMGQFLHALSKLERDLRTRTPHPLAGPPSLHAALLRGGDGLSTYAASSTVQIERRTVPGETAAQCVAEIQHIIDDLSADDPLFRAYVRPFFVRDPFEAWPQSALVKSVDRATAEVLHKPAQHMGDTPWMDAALLQAAGVDAVVIGPAGGGAHASMEWVDLESVVQLGEILVNAARDYCVPAVER